MINEDYLLPYWKIIDLKTHKAIFLSDPTFKTSFRGSKTSCLRLLETHGWDCPLVYIPTATAAFKEEASKASVLN